MLYKSQAAAKDEIRTAEMAVQLGIESNQLSVEQLKQLEPGIHFDVAGAIHYPGDAHLNPTVFMTQMISHLKSSGVEMLTHREVIHLEDRGTEGGVVSFANGQQMVARHVVVTSGIWSSRLMKKSGHRLPMQDGKGYSMNFSNLKKMPSIPSILHEARVAITPMGEDLRVSGTLEISGMDDRINVEKVKSILEAVPKYYPDVVLNHQVPVWRGYRPCSPDGMPYIGRFSPNAAMIMATGHAMMGMSLAPVTGRLVADEIKAGNNHVIHPKLSPGRF
jgi:D-amino-acid dehydrogenase